MILHTEVTVLVDTTSTLPEKNGILLKISETVLVRKHACGTTQTAGVKSARL